MVALDWLLVIRIVSTSLHYLRDKFDITCLAYADFSHNLKQLFISLKNTTAHQVLGLTIVANAQT